MPTTDSTRSDSWPTEAPGGDTASLKAQLRHAQKLASLGTTSAMLAHEYNNVLAPVVSYAQYALDNDDVPLMRKTLNLMLQQYRTIQTISDRLLEHACHGAEGIARVNIHQVVQDAVACLGRDLAKDNIRLIVKVEDDLWITGNHNQLQQVLFNLVLNARQAMLGKPGMLKISATPITGNKVTVHVRDNGKGIDEDDLHKVFDAFFSTKRNEEQRDKRGLGLGLAICKEIIEEHGGEISVESIQNHGTTFTILLPLEDQ